MKTIHQLPENIVSKIAAGEVIERPAYAVKELIENAIDAKATSINIHIEQAGLKKIVVIDNGIGMSTEDIQECFKPHTTSKVFSEDQLIGIASFGFRGEALASIASVSTMTIKSRTKNQIAGTLVELNKDSLEKSIPIGMPVGTSITVHNVFHTIPARKAFLKSTTTEFRHILDIVTYYALAYPKVAFQLTHNAKTILNLTQNQTVEIRIQALLGHDIFEQLLPIFYEDTYLKLSGYIAKPQLTGSNKQFIFINNRRIWDKTISQAVKEAYGNILETTASPIFILFLHIPYEMVDVNVHPRKEQVNFVNNHVIIETIQKTVEKALKEQNITYEHPDWKLFSPRKGHTASFAGQLLRDAVIDTYNTKKTINTYETYQFHNLYLISQTKDALIIFDQHAAHERILFEQFSKVFLEQRQKKDTFDLEKPETFDLSVTDSEILKEQLSFFASLGFGIEQFHDTTFTLLSVPFLFKDRDVVAIIKELIEDIRNEKNSKAIDKTSYRMLTYLACRSAVKAGDKLLKEERKKLLEDLETTENNVTCPHGRPTKIVIPLRILHRMFKRR